MNRKQIHQGDYLHCPKCGERADRYPNQNRYSCRDSDCGWEGEIPLAIGPCPFCKTRGFLHKHQWGFQCGCDSSKCQSNGPVRLSAAEAIMAWNETAYLKFVQECQAAFGRIGGIYDGFRDVPDGIGQLASHVLELSEYRDKTTPELQAAKTIIAKLAEGADKAVKELNVVQPFFMIWKYYGDYIEQCRAEARGEAIPGIGPEEIKTATRTKN